MITFFSVVVFGFLLHATWLWLCQLPYFAAKCTIIIGWRRNDWCLHFYDYQSNNNRHQAFSWQTTIHSSRATHHGPLITGHSSRATHHRPLVTGHSSPVVFLSFWRWMTGVTMRNEKLDARCCFFSDGTWSGFYPSGQDDLSGF